jgi:hypothetical protein
MTDETRRYVFLLLSILDKLDNLADALLNKQVRDVQTLKAQWSIYQGVGNRVHNSRGR